MKFQCIVHQTYRDDVQCPIQKSPGCIIQNSGTIYGTWQATEKCLI